MPNVNRVYERVPLTKSGIVPFRGSELREHGADPRKWYFIWRPADVLHRALREFEGCPLLSTHTRTLGLDAARWQGAIVGATGTKARLDDDGYIRNAISIWDPRAIDDIENGAAAQLSVGLKSQIEFVRGHEYDGVMRACHVDHVAVVERGKLGSDCAIDADGDYWRQLADVLGAFPAT